MSNPYDENPQSQDSAPNPYAPSGQYQPNPTRPGARRLPTASSTELLSSRATASRTAHRRSIPRAPRSWSLASSASSPPSVRRSPGCWAARRRRKSRSAERITPTNRTSTSVASSAWSSRHLCRLDRAGDRDQRDCARRARHERDRLIPGPARPSAPVGHHDGQRDDRRGAEDQPQRRRPCCEPEAARLPCWAERSVRPRRHRGMRRSAGNPAASSTRTRTQRSVRRAPR